MGIGGMTGTTGKNDNTRPRRDESQLELPFCGSVQSPWRAHPASLVLLTPCESSSEAATFLPFQSFGMRIPSNASSLCISGCWNNRGIFHALSCFSTIPSSPTIPWTLSVPHVFMMFSPFSLPSHFKYFAFMLPCLHLSHFLALSPASHTSSPPAPFAQEAHFGPSFLYSLHHTEQFSKALWRRADCLSVSKYFPTESPLQCQSHLCLPHGFSKLQTVLNWYSSERKEKK